MQRTIQAESVYEYVIVFSLYAILYPFVMLAKSRGTLRSRQLLNHVRKPWPSAVGQTVLSPIAHSEPVGKHTFQNTTTPGLATLPLEQPKVTRKPQA